MNKNNQAPVKGSWSSYKISEILKFLVPSLIGVTLFMLPVSQAGGITIPIAMLSNWVQAHFADVLPTVVLFLVMITVIGTIVTKLFTPKLILKNEDDLDKDNKKYSKNFNKEMSQYDIVQYLINTDDTLYYTYNLYQGIIKSINNRDKNKFLNIIHNVDKKKLNKYSKTAIKTFLNFENYIVNAFDYELSNGLVEGTNNIIKQLKHNACGYRKFSHLKARVMLVKGIYNPLAA